LGPSQVFGRTLVHGETNSCLAWGEILNCGPTGEPAVRYPGTQVSYFQNRNLKMRGKRVFMLCFYAEAAKIVGEKLRKLSSFQVITRHGS
jgi:hypothetical protein